MSDIDPDAAAREFAQRLSSRRGSTGIPRPPSIEVNDTTIDVTPINFELGSPGASRALRGGGGSPPPPPMCPSTVVVTFHDVLFDCGCVLRPIGSGDLTDVGLFNEIPVTLSAVVPVWDPACQSCLYEWSSGDLAVHARLYLNADCTSLSSEGDVVFSGNINLWKDLGGLWHLRLDFFSNEPLVFYGTSTSLSLPFNNLIACSYDRVLWPTPDCTSSFYNSVGAHGGNATIV